MMKVLGGNGYEGFRVLDTTSSREYLATSNGKWYVVTGPDGHVAKRKGALSNRVIGALQRCGYPVIK